MGPIEATQSVLANYSEFSGRASRSEYWWFCGVWTLAYFAVLGLQRGKLKWPEYAFIALTIVPVMSVSFRRLQDAGYSGWWSVAELLAFSLPAIALYVCLSNVDETTTEIPNGARMAISAALSLVAAIGIVWHFSLPSEPGSNQYGPNPHEVTS